MNRAAWWPLGAPAETASVRLVCLAYAGGGASIFRHWRRAAAPGLDLCAVQLPGREGRIREPAFRRMEPLVEALLEELRPWLHLPYAVFGHSMGALIGFALAHRARALGLPEPLSLFVSAARPPHLPARGAPLHGLPDAAFVSALRDFDGTPEAVLSHNELMELLLPVLRADFEVCETYRYRDEGPLACPITAFRGADDPSVSEPDIQAWAPLSSARFVAFTLPGGHFFLEPAFKGILRQVEASLAGIRDDAAGRHGDNDELEGSTPRALPGAR